MNDKLRRDDTETLYIDQREHEESEQGLEIEEVEEVKEIEEAHALLYYLRKAAISVIIVFGIFVALFFGFILLGIIGITIFLVALFFGFLLLLGFLRR